MVDTAPVQVYGKPDCPDTQRIRALLEADAIAYEWLDVTEDPERQKEAMWRNGGIDKVPTVVAPGGVVLVEPTDDEVRRALTSEGSTR